MRYRVMEVFKVKTSLETIELTAGQIITLSADKADMLIKSGKVKPVRDLLSEGYRELCRWLKSYPATDEDIKKACPELLNRIHESIEVMDRYFLSEDLQGFNEAMQKVKYLYLQAVERITL